jgi:hypothetical protein
VTVKHIETRIGVECFLTKTRLVLLDGSYRPRPVRRVMIPKRGKPGLFRPLVSLGVEFSLIVGAENSLAGAWPEGLGRAPDLRAVRPSPIIPSDMIRIGGGGGPAWRTDDDLGPSPPGIVRERDCAAYGSRPEDGSQIH